MMLPPLTTVYDATTLNIKKSQRQFIILVS